MKYEHQINWTNAYNYNLDVYTVRFASDQSVVPYFTPSSLLLYDYRNQTNSYYNFLRIKRVHALDSSVSFKPTSVDFDFLIVCYPCQQFSIAMIV